MPPQSPAASNLIEGTPTLGFLSPSHRNTLFESTCPTRNLCNLSNETTIFDLRKQDGNRIDNLHSASVYRMIGIFV